MIASLSRATRCDQRWDDDLRAAGCLLFDGPPSGSTIANSMLSLWKTVIGAASIPCPTGELRAPKNVD
jgi:hypothetical protein